MNFTKQLHIHCELDENFLCFFLEPTFATADICTISLTFSAAKSISSKLQLGIAMFFYFSWFFSPLYTLPAAVNCMIHISIHLANLSRTLKVALESDRYKKCADLTVLILSCKFSRGFSFLIRQILNFTIFLNKHALNTLGLLLLDFNNIHLLRLRHFHCQKCSIRGSKVNFYAVHLEKTWVLKVLMKSLTLLQLRDWMCSKKFLP